MTRADAVETQAQRRATVLTVGSRGNYLYKVLAVTSYYGNIFAFCHISVSFAVFKDEEKTADKLNFFIFSLSKQKNL